jgi:signal transduction histidine kinase
MTSDLLEYGGSLSGTQHPPASSGPVPGPDADRPRILVADDDDDTRSFLLKLLDKDYTVTGVSNGLEAMAAIEDQTPDLIISDVMMPHADAYDLLEHLSSHPKTRDLPVILLSGRAESSERTRGLEKGARDYIAKPLDGRELLARIKIHLQLAQSRRAAEAQISQLTDRLVNIQDKERKRIARDLHDQIGQQLTALRFQLEILRGISREAKLVERIEETQTIAKQLDSDIDFLTWELHSTALECVDIVGALANYVSEWSRRFGILADFQIKNLDQGLLSSDVKTNLYRIVQEALHNIAKHARADRAKVLIEGGGDLVELSIEDDGIGFNLEKLKTIEALGTGMGMVGMKERAAVMGAELTVDSKPGSGTKIRVRVPVEQSKTHTA